MIRLFAAVAIPPDIAADLRERMRGIPGARWHEADKLHITLRFFGEVREDVADDLDGELSRIVQAPFDLALKGVGSFGEDAQSRAVWAGVEESVALRTLAGRCDAAARRSGLKPEARSYKPHATLAYLRQAPPDRIAAWLGKQGLLRTAPFRVTWFGLWSSVLHGDGSRYRLEREYPLR